MVGQNIMKKNKKQLVTLGHSPDADDAFMFYALAKETIPTDGIQVVHVIEDIESLNQRALKGELEVTAVSIHAYAYIFKSSCVYIYIYIYLHTHT